MQTAEQLYLVGARQVARELARPHAIGGFALLEERTDDLVLPGQHPLESEVIGNRLPRSQTDQMADLVMEQHTDGKYTKIRDELANQPDIVEIIDGVESQLKDGGNVTVVTPHAAVTDIAFGLKLVGDLLDDRAMQPQTGIIVSKMLPELGYNTGHGSVPAVEVLKMLCSRIFFSWPRTESAKGPLSKLPSSEVANHNREMLERIMNCLRDGQFILAFAPTGTTKPSRTAAGRTELSPFSPNTTRLLTHPRAKVLPVIAEFFKKHPVAALPSNLIKLDGEKDVEDFRQELGTMYQNNAALT